jgi:hypothetical protein
MSEWIFTWGTGHRHPVTGESLMDRFVVIPAEDYESARRKMVGRFGTKWCGQYESREAAGVARFDLRELVVDTSDARVEDVTQGLVDILKPFDADTRTLILKAAASICRIELGRTRV